MRAYQLAVALVVVVSSSATARSAQAVPAADVTICVTGDSTVPGLLERRAMATVTWMYARIGVRVAWRHGDPRPAGGFASPVVIHALFAGQQTASHSLAALAYASPFDGEVKTIFVLIDRIQRSAGGSNREQHILAHVLAHEIAHVLQGTNCHARTGVMKAAWNSLDFDAMQSKPLEFTSADVHQIKQGLKRLSARAGAPAGGTP